MKNKKMFLIIAVAVLLGIGGYFGYGQYQDWQKANELERQKEQARQITDDAYKHFPGTWTIEHSHVEITFYENGSYYLVDNTKGNLRGKWHIAPAFGSNPRPVLWLSNDWLLFLITDDDIFWAWKLTEGPKNKSIFHRKIK